ncbi:MAG: ammonium transporter [Flavobacteriaceae bacterium]|jgi:Amt family ammonium transporter|uniref:Ammonium transporter n=1 Tax=Flavobacterium kayseriense TaxID=2764714 RepID=A0ABR7JAS6_9FLAO|nr:ammonium transporter [Flavobacterium kayseriense]MBC5842552.1 ammonium transporter [Flavobacterium kayseriense]MBC5849082.1 ammonium transporter [Flavobacterium kayseriense]MBU0942435.1 ammonium transporter [Bacteroidota bacterium]MBX9886713.1 ammonium transporter [Flavobacteriaceae bacterium]
MDTNGVLDLMWVLICAILVFFMQAGFTLVETGFSRSKNAGNIIMKNLMDFCIGSIAFWALGYSLMYGDSISGFIGTPSLFFDTAADMHSLFFQTVFAATAATIVSGAIAERTKFTTYLFFSLLMTLVIYPISGSWVWNAGGWLAQLGFTDFAGSTVVHSLGGWASLVAAIMVGPRIGKYNLDGTTNAIQGHSLMLGALGVFILWMGWFGFNPGSQLAISGDNALAVASIFITTNLAAASGAIAAMFLTWMIYKKPDISMTLNGVLAGLVGVTAGCAAVSPAGAFAIGIICGISVVFSIEFIDKKLKIDDPVGAISVHGVCGAIGTLLVGVFATDGGLLYGGGFEKLGIQAIGVFSIAAWALATSFAVLFILKKTMGLRVSKEEEIDGLDIHEHGTNCYND